ncbi:MAG TPA: protein-tyrosine kinase [Candidatus Mediterraneibacter quadrami]|uniref:Protein-tyrosine kinase n=1 Tax=Candidatus Mediterraneibacter quadrami TaxID=2838684 RepID=A0A9D2U5Q2_9FIRM|nr:protein-tyrosine kinase [Candidatus Mediterraneibacter quadrami]
MNQERVTHEVVENDEITIDLTELFAVLWARAYIIIIAGLLLALAAFAGTQLFITPKYTSTTSMYMLARSDESGAVTSGDLQTGTQLTQDYMELVKSRTVLEEVISVLNLEMEPEELSDAITTSNPDNTRILTIQVEDEDPEVAREIADAVRESASNTIQDIMEIDAVNTVEEANLPTTPSSPSVFRNTAIGGFIGIVIAMGIIVLIYVFDDTIKTPEDVENYLGLNVLTSIPIQEGEQKPKRVKRKTTRKMMRKRR